MRTGAPCNCGQLVDLSSLTQRALRHFGCEEMFAPNFGGKALICLSQTGGRRIFDSKVSRPVGLGGYLLPWTNRVQHEGTEHV